jgi:hypothetical protein
MAMSSVACYPVVVVSDRRSWVDRVVPACRELGAVAEVRGWSAVSTVSGPLAALLADVTRPSKRRAGLFAEWARRLWYPLCLVSLAPDPGAAEFFSQLRGRGYVRITQTAHDADELGQWMRSGLEGVLSGRLWLVPLVAERLGAPDRRVVRALCAALEMVPGEVTVEHWAQRLGWRTRQPLERLFRERGLPSPKDVLAWLRILVVASVAEYSPEPVSAGGLAEEFNYGSGKYLRRRIREVTGRPYEEVLDLGLEGVLELMRERLTPGRRSE